MSEKSDPQRSRKATDSGGLPRNVAASASMKPAPRSQARNGGDSDSSSEDEDGRQGGPNGGRGTDYSIANYLVRV